MKTNPRLFWLGVICIVIGLGLILAGFFLSDIQSTYPNAFLAYLTTNLGGLMVFGASYTLISEGYLRRDFAREMSIAIERTLRGSQIDHSIAQSGLFQIVQPFSHQTLHERVVRAQTVKMIFVKNTMYFREYHESLRERIADGKLNLEVVIPAPNDLELMAVIVRRYDEFNSGHQLSESIVSSINVWLKGKIYDELPENSKEKLLLYLSNHNPLYSAYLFDREELWYVPYHCRMGRHGIPVLVYHNVSDELPVYRDILHIFQSSTRFDLANSLTLESKGKDAYSAVP